MDGVGWVIDMSIEIYLSWPGGTVGHVTGDPLPEDEDLRVLAVALHDLAWLLPRTVDPESEAGLDALPGSELEVMRLLVRRPGLTVGAVARELGLQPPNASASVRTLIARGLLARERDPDDGRSVRLRPTARAIENRNRREVAWARVLGERIVSLPAADRARLRRGAGSLRALADVLTQPPVGRSGVP